MKPLEELESEIKKLGPAWNLTGKVDRIKQLINKMKKTEFKVGDKVFDYVNGKGEVIEISSKGTYPIKVNFNGHDLVYTEDGRVFRNSEPTLSFTEYTLEGFSQERPEEVIEVDTVVYYQLFTNDNWHTGHYCNKYEGLHQVFSFQSNRLSNKGAFPVKCISLTNPLLDESK